MKKFISIICVFAIIFTLAGCSMKDSPEKIVSTFSDAMISYDKETKNACLQNPPEDDGEGLDEMIKEDEEGMLDVITFLKDNAASIKYTIEGSEVTDSSATVTVKYTYNDGTKVGQDILTDYFQAVFALAFTDISEDEMEKKATEMFVSTFNEKVKDVKFETCDATVKFECIKTEDGWKIKEQPKEIDNIMTCNIAKAFDDFADENSDDSEEAEDANYIDVQINKAAELAKFKITTTKVEEKTKLTDPNEWYDDKTAEDGTKYVIYYLTFENITKNAETIDLYGVKLTDSQGRSFEYDDEADDYFESINYESVNPSMKKSGVVVFNVPIDATDYYITLGKDGTNDYYKFLAK